MPPSLTAAVIVGRRGSVGPPATTTQSVTSTATRGSRPVQRAVHVHEVACQDAGRLGLQELQPGRRCPPRRCASEPNTRTMNR